MIRRCDLWYSRFLYPMLPVEILDHILSYLATDHVALKTCLRAHPVFSDLVKRYLYAHIVVLNKPTVNSHGLNPAQLAKLLLSNVCVADHVHSLHMTVSALGNNQWQEMDVRMVSTHDPRDQTRRIYIVIK